jgi:hypothetical protein
MLVYVELLIYLLILFGIIFPIFYCFYFLHISKASPRLTPYRLKGKKGVGRLRTPYRLKNYASKFMTDPVRILVKRDELTLEVNMITSFLFLSFINVAVAFSNVFLLGHQTILCRC